MAASSSNIEDHQNNQDAGFDKPVIKASNAPQAHAQVYRGMRIECQVFGMNWQVQEKVGKDGEPDRRSDSASTPDKQERKECRPYQNHEQRMGPVVVPCRGLAFDAERREGNPQDVGQEGSHEQSPGRGIPHATLDCEASAEMSSVHYYVSSLPSLLSQVSKRIGMRMNANSTIAATIVILMVLRLMALTLTWDRAIALLDFPGH